MSLDKRPQIRRALHRTTAFIVCALLLVTIKSPAAVAQSASLQSAHRQLASVDGELRSPDQARTTMAAMPNDPATALENEASGDGLSVTTTVQPLHIRTEFHRYRVTVPTRPVVRLSADVAPGTNKVLRRGVPAITIVTERVVRWNSIAVDRQVVGKELAQRARPALIAAGPPRNVTEALALTKFRKLVGVFAMIATAYTADSAQGGGRTAIGLPARYGVVAVDPRIIPLGAHVFIPGYGTAIAADTGGAIVGNRIDLCMNSLQAALTFGRQPVRVYVLGL